jgi:hypothetical protein
MTAQLRKELAPAAWPAEPDRIDVAAFRRRRLDAAS